MGYFLGFTKPSECQMAGEQIALTRQQVQGMEKLYYYVLQTDWMLLRWLSDAEIRVLVLHHDGTYNAMTNTDENVFDEEAADSSGDDDKEEDSDDDDNCLVRDDNVDNDANEESGDDNSLFGANIISSQEQVLFFSIVFILPIYNSFFTCSSCLMRKSYLSLDRYKGQRLTNKIMRMWIHRRDKVVHD
jgi:hypothetical protein